MRINVFDRRMQNLKGTNVQNRYWPLSFGGYCKHVAIVFSILTLLGLWEILALYLDNSLLFPGIPDLFSAISGLFFYSDFWTDIYVTLIRGMSGMVIALFISFALAHPMAHNLFLKSYIQPFLSIFRATPIISIILLLLIWLRPEQIPFVMALITMVPVVTENLVAGYENFDIQMREMMTLYRIPVIMRVKYFYYPSLKPYLFSGLISASGLGWKAIIMGEVLAQPQWGIGVSLKEAHGFIEIPVLIAWTLVAVFLSYCIEQILRFLSKKKFPFHFSGVPVQRNKFVAPVSFKNVTKGYGKHVVFRNLSLKIPQGKITCITGPSGCGKTTLLRMIAGLETPQSGIIERSGNSVSYLFQKPVFVSQLTVLQNILWPLSRHMSIMEATDLAISALERMGIEDKAHCMPETLSGGEQQRVALIRTFLYPASIILLDEPFTGLNQALKENIMDMIKVWHQEHETTLLYVTHHADETGMAQNHIILNNMCAKEYEYTI